MYPHHARAVARLVAELGDDARYLALLVGGSIAKGRERPDSDVDLVLVVTDDEFARHEAAGTMQYLNTEIADWAGGYVEGKRVPLRFLEEVADHGSEPARSAFQGASVGFSHLPELEALLALIPVYPEADRAAKMASFYAQVEVLTWYVPEAEKRGDAYLLAWAASNLSLFAGRLILAHNRILFPFHKWFMYEVRHAPDQPVEFLPRLDALLGHPTAASAEALRDSIAGFQDWGLTRRQAFARYIVETEWSWRTGPPALIDS
ncbi:MAG TPA: nucleotidyltransferase domain-containing protein [Chloroflexia bacterium]|nr:nucleotidyltransferase domain-containing protein [Chloroflexia bacterium]